MEEVDFAGEAAGGDVELKDVGRGGRWVSWADDKKKD